MNLKEMVKSHKWMFIVGGVVVLLAISGVIYGVITKAGDEGLMVRNGHELKWDRADFPVGCFYQSGYPADYANSYETARQRLNKAAGKTILGICTRWQLKKEIKEAPSGSILLRIRPVEERPDGYERHGATTEHRYNKENGRILAATVSVDDGLSGQLLYEVTLHELGHVLGLDHDRNKSSFMYPIALDRSGDLSKKDIDLLKEIY